MHLNVLFHECHIAASAKLGRQIRTANAHCDTKKIFPQKSLKISPLKSGGSFLTLNNAQLLKMYYLTHYQIVHLVRFKQLSLIERQKSSTAFEQ